MTDWDPMRQDFRDNRVEPASRKMEQARRELRLAARSGDRGAKRKAKSVLNQYRKDLEYED